MSGIAKASSTIPGSVATFTSCSSDRSPRIASSSSASAKTRAGTRMSGRKDAGISQSVASMRRSASDIEHHPGPPARAGGGELKVMIGHRLHDVGRVAPAPTDMRVQPARAERDLGVLGHEALRLGQKDELLEPRRE